MKTVKIDNHDFNKVNLVTTKKGDLYRCSSCGVSGYRVGLEPIIRLTDSDFKKSMKCKLSISAIDDTPNRPKEVLTNDLPYLGIEYGIHKVVDCPKTHIEFKNDVWVFSKSRNEEVRLFSHEYEIVE